MVLLSPSPSLGSAPAAGNPALDLPETVHAVLGQPDHQLHALCRWGRRLLLPGKEPRSRCTAGRMEEEEEEMWGLASTEPEIEAIAPGRGQGTRWLGWQGPVWSTCRDC